MALAHRGEQGLANSIREQIIRSAIAAIDAAVTTATVYRSREAALAAEQLPAVVVMPLNDVPSERGTSLCWLDWSLTLGVDVVTGSGLDADGDPILQLVHSAIMGRNRSLGLDAVHDVSPGVVQFVAANREQPVGVTRMTFIVGYRTSHADVTVAP